MRSLLCAVLVMALACSGFGDQLSPSAQKALKEFPSLADEKSPLFIEFKALADRYTKEKNPILSSPDAFFQIAQIASDNLKHRPTVAPAGPIADPVAAEALRKKIEQLKQALKSNASRLGGQLLRDDLADAEYDLEVAEGRIIRDPSRVSNNERREQRNSATADARARNDQEWRLMQLEQRQRDLQNQINRDKWLKQQQDFNRR